MRKYIRHGLRQIRVEKWRGFKCKIPEAGETILTDTPDFESFIDDISSVNIYFRGKEVDPNWEDHWMVDIIFKEGALLYFKYPPEMREDEIYNYLNPILSKLDKIEQS